MMLACMMLRKLLLPDADRSSFLDCFGKEQNQYDSITGYFCDSGMSRECIQNAGEK